MSEKLAFVIPAYNEEKTLGLTLDDVKKNFPKAEIFVVDDGSADKTREIAKSKKVHVLQHVINRGLGAALGTGIIAAIAYKADYIVTFDADLQHTGKDVNRLIEPLKKGKADVSLGSRFLDKKDLEMMPAVKRIGNSTLTGITNILAGTKVTDSQSGLRGFTRQAAEKLMIICDKYEVSSEIIYELGKKHLRIVEVPIKAIYYDVKKGTTIKSGVHIAWSMVLKKIGVKR
ncbi:MAG: glycosyltransferase family 2 protein [archaeon]